MHQAAASKNTHADIKAIADDVAAKCLASRLHQLERIVSSVYEKELRPLGITSWQYVLLCRIAQRSDWRAATIAREFNIERSTLSRCLKLLQKLGLLAIGPPRGQFGCTLRLTPKGEETVEQAYPAWQRARVRALDLLGSGSTHTFDTLLEQAKKS